MSYKYDHTARSGGALWWFFHRLSGLYLALVLFVHVLVLHVLMKDEIAYGTIIERVSTPLWKTINISFLIVALLHGLYGLWIVLGDYCHKQWMRIFIWCAIAVIGLVFTIYGTLTMLSLQHGG
jgi:succinate dehydrogenase / fumarate reductase membrane anchor subunit